MNQSDSEILKAIYFRDKRELIVIISILSPLGFSLVYNDINRRKKGKQWFINSRITVKNPQICSLTFSLFVIHVKDLINVTSVNNVQRIFHCILIYNNPLENIIYVRFFGEIFCWCSCACGFRENYKNLQ